MESFDVAVLGGGLAGGLLARQLARRAPELRIGVFEKSTETSYKVGEATVEIAANHLIRRHGLSRYLYEEHLPKNGLRYFFDDEHRSAPLERMSEIGTMNLPFHPAFQIDRARLERDLLDMNREAGVDVRVGVRVRDVSTGRGGEPHRFVVEDGLRRREVSARWLVDAAGRSGLLARREGLRVPDEEHRIGSAWARFEGVADVDERGTEPFRARVRHTHRRLSTIHFWYPGYWIWFIPLRGGVTSIGVTGHVVNERGLRSTEALQAFLREHRAIASLLEEARAVDFGSYTRIAYGTKRFFSPDRWGLTGEAATAADPLYSPGSDFISLENDFLCDLVTRDVAGESRDALAERASGYDAFMRFRHEATMLLYAGLYDCLGSFEVSRMKWDFDIACYYTLWTSAYLRDRHLDPQWLGEQLRLRPFVLATMRRFGDLFREVTAALRKRGEYFRGNLDHFHYGLENIGFAEEIGAETSDAEALGRLPGIFNGVRAQALERLGCVRSRRDVEPLPLASFIAGRALV